MTPPPRVIAGWIALICTVPCLFVLAALGAAYHYEGSGLHPALAATLAAVLLVAGATLAVLIDREER